MDPGAFARPDPGSELVDVVGVRAGQYGGVGNRGPDDLTEHAVELRLAVVAAQLVVAGVRLAVDLVRPHRPVRHAELGRGVGRHPQLARWVARRDRGHGLDPRRAERPRGEREHHRRVDPAGERHQA